MVIYFDKIYWTIISRNNKEFIIFPDHLFKTRKEAEEYRKKTYTYSYCWKSKKITLIIK